MDTYFDELIIGAATFLTIGLFHPLAIKLNTYMEVKKRNFSNSANVS